MGAGRADGGLEQVPAAVADPEIDHLKSLYRDEFQTAFSDALGALTERERNVLRQHYIDDFASVRACLYWRPCDCNVSRTGAESAC